MENKYTQVGQIGKSFGTDGFNRIKSYDEFKNIVLEQTFLFLEEEDYFVPYRVSEWARANSMIRFDDVSNQEQADRLQAKKIYLKDEELKDVNSSRLPTFVGYTVFDDDVEIGKILTIQELPHQLLAVVAYGKEEVYIPIVEDLILEIIPNDKKLRMNLPEGILDINS